MTQPDQIQARNAALDMLEEKFGYAMRLVSPVPTTIVEGVGYMRGLAEAATLRHCPICTPAPEVFSCPICDWETTERWRFKLHTDLNLKWCAERGARKVRAWANKT